MAKMTPKALRSEMQTTIVTKDDVDAWVLPPFQRPLRINYKVTEISDFLKSNGGMMSDLGVITLGSLEGDKSVYIVDGQHRKKAFEMSGLREMLVDIRKVHFESMADMAAEFVHLNSSIVRMRPDDILRGLEPNMPVLARIRANSPFVGYDQIRKGSDSGPVLSMSTAIRSWYMAKTETPGSSTTRQQAGGGVASLAQALSEREADAISFFLNEANSAWGRDPEHRRLWAALNLTMCLWLWNNMVMVAERSTMRHSRLTVLQFRHCLMALSADEDYTPWLVGRLMRDADRSPCYRRVRAVFLRRMAVEGVKHPKMPLPAWFGEQVRPD